MNWLDSWPHIRLELFNSFQGLLVAICAKTTSKVILKTQKATGKIKDWMAEPGSGGNGSNERRRHVEISDALPNDIWVKSLRLMRL